MWTVVEMPFAPIPGHRLRHLVEMGGDKTACGDQLTGATEVRVSWRRAADRCPACEQIGGVHSLN